MIANKDEKKEDGRAELPAEGWEVCKGGGDTVDFTSLQPRKEHVQMGFHMLPVAAS